MYIELFNGNLYFTVIRMEYFLQKRQKEIRRNKRYAYSLLTLLIKIIVLNYIYHKHGFDIVSLIKLIIKNKNYHNKIQTQNANLIDRTEYELVMMPIYVYKLNGLYEELNKSIQNPLCSLPAYQLCRYTAEIIDLFPYTLSVLRSVIGLTTLRRS